MKNLKFLLPLFAIILGTGIAFTGSAFKAKVVSPAKSSTYWRFDSTNISDLRDASKYVKVTNPEAPSCEDGNDLPCVFEAPASVTTNVQLNTHLNNTSLFPNDQDIIDASMYKKEAPARR